MKRPSGISFYRQTVTQCKCSAPCSGHAYCISYLYTHKCKYIPQPGSAPKPQINLAALEQEYKGMCAVSCWLCRRPNEWFYFSTYFTTKLETNLKHFVKIWSRVFRTSDWVESSPSNQTMTLNSQPSQLEGGFERFWMEIYNTSALHHLIDFALNVELWVFGLDTFQLDGYLLSNRDVSS